MRASSVTYKFSQLLPAPAKQAYLWCTDYKPDDLALMQLKGRRKIERLSSDTIILREIVERGRKKIKKIKLIKLDPAVFSWYNIQIYGPNKYSAFLYQLKPINRRKSKLNFTGLMVLYSKARLSQRAIKEIAETERSNDASAWKLLAKVMEQQVKVD